ncbi:MAG TPA: DUF1062 domain-containing protein [Haliangiales bacterium]|nr:DUF1062 domain-containing protein [Haliangiales bacterium]
MWSVVARETPRVRRRCPRCDGPRQFVSSDKFRINAQKRRLDVWLVHRCEACDCTWNLTVLERVAPEDIEPARYARFLANHRDEAWAAAFRGPGDRRVAWDVRVDGSGDDVVVRLVHPVDVRLDRLAARALGVPRAEVARRLAVAPDALRRRARDGAVLSRSAHPRPGDGSGGRSAPPAPPARGTAPWRRNPAGGG